MATTIIRFADLQNEVDYIIYQAYINISSSISATNRAADQLIGSFLPG